MKRKEIVIVVVSTVAALFVPPTGVPALVCSMLYMNGNVNFSAKERLKVVSVILDVCSLIIAFIVAVRLLMQ